MKKILIGIFVLMLLSGIVSGCASCMGDCSEGCEGGEWYPEYAITNVYYDYASKTLSWYDNSNAQEWIVNIGPIGGDKKEETVTTTSYTYEADKKGFEVSIEGLHEKKGSEINPTTNGVITFHYLPVATGLDIENGKLVWDSVLGASAYNVYNNGGLLATVSECEVVVPVGPFSLKVEPIVTGERQYSYSDAPTIFDGVILSSPTGANYADGVLTWDAVNGADYYDVVINDGEPMRVNGQTSLEYDGAKKDVKVSIAAGSHAERAYPAEPYKVTFTYIPPITEFSLNDDNKLVWPAAEKATYYEIYINGENRGTVELPGIDGIMLDTEYTIKVIPRAEFSYTDSAAPYNFMCMSMIEGIRFDNGVVYWNAHGLAKSYEVRVNGKSFIVERDPTDPNAAPMLETNIKEEDVSIQVFAMGEKENFRSYKANTITYRYLKPVTGMALNEDGNLTWTSVTNATYYEIFMLEELYGEIRRTSLGTVSTNEFTNITPNTPYNVEIIPHCDLSYTGTPGSFKFEKLTPVNNVVFNNGIITWDKHNRAAEYEVVITDLGTKKTETFKTTDTKYKLGNITKSIGIQVFAVGEGDNCRSFTSSKEPYNYLPTVTNLRVEDGILKWDASKSDLVAGYTVKFVKNNDNTTKDVAINEYASLLANTQYVVQVIPRGTTANCFSYYSAEFTFEILEAPTIRYQQGKFIWNGTGLAEGYTARITDPEGNIKYVEVPDFAQDTSFITGPGEYQIAVKAKATKDNENLYDSAYSNTMSITQLADVTGHKVDDSANDVNNFCFNITPVPGAVAYKVFVNEAEVQSSNETKVRIDIESLLTNPSGETNFVIEVLAIGATDSSKIVLDAKNKYAFNVTKLATPQNLSFEGNTVMWDNVSHTAKYLISIDGTVYESTTSSYKLTTLSAGQHRIKIRALAMPTDENAENPTEYMTSNWSRELTFTKLAAPTGVTLVSASGGKTHLTWTSANEEQFGFAVKIGSSEPINWTLTQYDISTAIGSLVDGTGVQITVYAKGNGSTYMDSDPSATITVAKLAAPSNITISGNNLVWTAPAIDGITPDGYTLFVKKVGSTEAAQEIPVNGTSYRLADLPDGKITVQVMALGNSTTTINSSKSEAVTINKFPQVSNVKAEGTKYTWDPIDGATLYEISVDGVRFSTKTPEYDMSNIFTSAKSYSISIYAVGNTANNTVSGTPYTFTQRVATLTAPRYVAGADPTALEAGTFTVQENGTSIVVTVKASDIVPVKYNYYIGGMTYANQAGDSYTYDIPMTGISYNVQVSFSCGSFATGSDLSSSVFYISSNKSEVIPVEIA